MKLSKIAFLSVFTFFQIFTSVGWSRNNVEKPIAKVSEKDKVALLFMLEEEKLARDTYTFLDKKWSIRQFSNIKNSEQMHIDAITDVLTTYGVSSTLLPMGKFKNPEMQRFYNQFVEHGSKSDINAIEIGATIEDLDISDLQKRIDQSQNTDIIELFTRLQSASKRHIRAFNFGLTSRGKEYTPKYLTKKAFNLILDSSQKCD